MAGTWTRPRVADLLVLGLQSGWMLEARRRSGVPAVQNASRQGHAAAARRALRGQLCAQPAGRGQHGYMHCANGSKARQQVGLPGLYIDRRTGGSEVNGSCRAHKATSLVSLLDHGLARKTFIA